MSNCRPGTPSYYRNKIADNLEASMFVQEYILDLNAYQAIQRVHNKLNAHGEPMSHTVIKNTADKLFSDPAVVSAIHEAAKERTERTKITADRVLTELYHIAIADIAGIFDGNGALKPVHDIPEDIRRCIASIEIDEIEATDEDGNIRVIGHTKKIKFWSKDKALENLAKHLRLVDDGGKGNNNFNFSFNLAERLKEAVERNRLKSLPAEASPN